MKDWERIKHIRKDMSEFVLHCTRDRMDGEGGERTYRSAFDALKLILQDGFFRAGFAVGRSALAREPKPKVKGSDPAVCFTEQPLRFFIESIKANRRYTEFAIAVRKDELFYYGGRPVIYADKQTLNELPPDLQYLWVHYDPTVIWERDYPIDFTHEREWRACPNIGLNKQLGLSQQDAEIAVPLQLLTKDSICYFVGSRPETGPRFAILVDSENRKHELSEWIDSNASRISERGLYWKKYANALQVAPILSFETINDIGPDLARLEDFINDNFTLKNLSPSL